MHSLDANQTPAVWKRHILRKPFSHNGKKTEQDIQEEALKAVLYNRDRKDKEIKFTGEHLANVHHDQLENIAKGKIQHLDAKQTQKFAKIIQEKSYKHAMDRSMALQHLSPEYESAHWRGESEEVRRELAKKPIENLAKNPFEKPAKKSAEEIARESIIREKIHEHVDLTQKHIDTYAKVSELARQHASKLRNDAIAISKKPSERTLKKLSKIEKTTQTTKDVRNLSETYDKQKKEEELQKAAQKAADEARQQRKEERGSSSPLVAKAKNMLGKISPLGSRRSGSKKGGDSDKEGSRDGSRDGNKSAGNSPRGSPRGPQS